MIFLLPSPYSDYGVPILPNECGYLLTPSQAGGDGKALHGYRWALDNECFSQGDKFNFDKYLSLCCKAMALPGECLWATVPDVVANADETARRWQRYAPAMRGIGLPLAYVAQDGMTALPGVDFDCLFIGGSTEWKLGATATRLICEAKQAGKWVHMGRVNSTKRLLHALKVGVDSVDGTRLTRAPQREIRWLLPALRAATGQARMF